MPCNKLADVRWHWLWFHTQPWCPIRAPAADPMITLKLFHGESTVIQAQRSVIASALSGNRSPITRILPVASPISARSAALSSTAAAPIFSSSRCGRIEERDAAIDRRAQQGHHLLFIASGAIREAHAHAAEPQRRHLEACGSKGSLLHVSRLQYSQGRKDSAFTASTGGARERDNPRSASQ